jgi:hypothetical protein
MDHTKMTDLYNDEILGSDADQELNTAIENRLKEVHTALPGIIKSYNPATNTVSVQPVLQRVFIDLGPQNLPLLEDVPVVFPSGGPFTITCPIAAGDECLLIFSERCIDFWYQNGTIKPPAVYRFHDLSDGFALVGIRNQTRNLSNIQTDAIEIRNADRSVCLRVTATGIEIVGNLSVQGNIVATGDVTVPSSVPDINITLSTHEHVNGTPQTSKPLPPTP